MQTTVGSLALRTTHRSLQPSTTALSFKLSLCKISHWQTEGETRRNTEARNFVRDLRSPQLVLCGDAQPADQGPRPPVTSSTDTSPLLQPTTLLLEGDVGLVGGLFS